MSHAGHVTEVRVFIDRATVCRQRTESMQEGLQTLDFEVLPSPLDTDTLRAQATLGQQNLAIIGVRAQAAYAEPSSTRMQQAQALLDEVEAKLRASEDAQDNDEHTVSMIARYAALTTNKLSLQWLDPDPAFDKWNTIFDQLRSSNAQLATSQAARAAENRRLHQRRAELEDELERLGRRTRVGHKVSVSLEVPAGGGEVTVRLHYVTRAAQWMPAYDARLEETEEGLQVRWTTIAMVKQVTGEDWSDVRLITTTARPPLSEPPPTLHKLQVAGFEAAPNREVHATHDAGARLGGGGGQTPAVAAQVEYEAPGQVHVPSTSRPVRIELFEAMIPAQRRLEVAALHREVATWVLDLENTTGRVLLPGAVSLFRGPNYSGRTELGFVQGAERFRLPLATEGSLRVTRRTHPQPARKTAVTGTQIFEYQTETKLENTGHEPIEVILLDRVPVSRSEQVQVERTQMPQGAELEEETGRFRLAVRVAPGATDKVVVAFRMTAPRGVSVQPPELL